ncbi:LuxR C-terminal-related transcriptional regulator [Paenibacillus sp. 19GGS1-52]|uniref:LuxR C-terminal-related transcriptional regulator n=1 Tax=Paenibacillus sp. 19GGS1-52 TaxID=2758563 RepID=UPI001EFA49CF|nr:LuxR C-terminal-related transcriptional regulator [Paenibacillus sp. 19GGS1-52]
MTIEGNAKLWYLLDDLEEQLSSSFKQIEFADLKLHSSFNAFSVNEKKSVYHTAMIQAIRTEMMKISGYISIPFIIFLADEYGYILDLISSSPDMQEDMNKVGLDTGVCLSKQYSGLNAVSLAMEMDCIGVVRGEEHSDATFKDWNCVCAPLYLDGAVQGYVDISFNRGQQIEFAIPFVQQIAENIMEKWMNKNSDLQRYRLETSFNDYKLTAREKEVALLWLMEKSALHASTELGISEGTVRNMIKSIYAKLNVSDRWQFAKKLAH